MKYNSKSRKRKGRKSTLQPLPKDYPWKVLGWLSEDLRQFLSVTDFDTISTLVRFRDQDGIQHLAKEWGLQSIPCTGGTEWHYYATRYQLAALLKKFRFDSDKAARVSRAVEKFHAGEAACSQFNREGYLALIGSSETWITNVFTYARSFLEKLLGWELPSFKDLTLRSRHGPGATLDTKHGLISTYFKYRNWPYQCTRAARGYARLLISSDERWLGALENDYRKRYGIPMYAILNQEVFWSNVFTEVGGNRISFVPKDAEVERSIAIEPTMNIFLQLGVDGFIRRRLKRWGVDLDSQEKNRRLAYLGSVQQEDSFVTIDLANASNCISMKLCEVLLPPRWYTYLCHLRSPKGTLEGSEISYEMIASMGNGYTFALESALFTAIVYAVMRETSGRFSREDFAVFGDDIIVRQHISSRVIHALSVCGFTVNSSKSFLEGCVRESCGTDWIQGHLARPVFLENIPTEVDELFCDFNRIKRLLELRWSVEESKTLSGLYRWIPEEFRKFTGPYSDEDFDSYIHSARPTVPYKRCMYKYGRIVRLPTEVRGESLSFRKLMHNLAPLPPVSSWKRDEFTGRRLVRCGGRFNVFRRGSFTLSTSYSVSSNWRSEYVEYRPTLL